MEKDRMDHIRKVILSTIQDGVLRVLAESSLVLVPPNFEDNVFDKAGINIELPNLSMNIERFVDTDHWWIEDEYYSYYTPEEMDNKLAEEISKSVIWIKIQ